VGELGELGEESRQAVKIGRPNAPDVVRFTRREVKRESFW